MVLPATPDINIFNSCGKPIVCRYLLEKQSQSEFWTETMAQWLDLKREKVNKSVSGTNEVINRTSYEGTA